MATYEGVILRPLAGASLSLPSSCEDRQLTAPAVLSSDTEPEEPPLSAASRTGTIFFPPVPSF